MALTLESIHKPFNDYFLSQFGDSGDSSTVFRFDKFGSVLSEADFPPANADLMKVAVEKFSDLVNHIPTDAGDSLNVILTSDSIDQLYYFRLLNPSIASVRPGMSDQEAAALMSSFGAVKDAAKKLWTNNRLESGTGLMLSYAPALATPTNWYDSAQTDAWTRQSFDISQPAQAAPTSNQLWRMKVSDAVIKSSFETLAAKRNISPAIAAAVFTAQPPAQSPSVATRLAPVRFETARLAASPAFAAAAPASQVGRIEPPEDGGFYGRYIAAEPTFRVADRVVLQQAVASAAETRPVVANRISISFDYCLVKIRRPWYMDAFINSTFWCVPQTSKGQLTSPGTAGNLVKLPVAFVAVRNLVIDANWASDDLANSASASDFGPFKIMTAIEDNKLIHPGLQIIAWVLQRLPDLPPNDSN